MTGVQTAERAAGQRARRRRITGAQPRQVLLHVGHGKTGSSFLQSTLANSLPILAAEGLAYPIDPEKAAHARAGGISSGNLVPSAHAIKALLANGWEGPQDRLLISSESFFGKMHAKRFAPALRAALPGAELQVLLYVRDPLDHAVSHYQQTVKRSGYTGDFESFLQDYNIPARVARFLDWLQGELPGVQVTLRNYSRHKDDLLATFEDWLGLPAGRLTPPQTAQVNRSLTNAELMLQRAFNTHLDAKTAQIVSDALCEALPAIRSERPPASPAALTAFLQAMQEMIAGHGFDRILPEGEHYRIETPEEAIARFAPEAPEHYAFTAEQLRVVAAAVAGYLQPGEG